MTPDEERELALDAEWRREVAQQINSLRTTIEETLERRRPSTREQFDRSLRMPTWSEITAIVSILVIGVQLTQSYSVNNRRLDELETARAEHQAKIDKLTPIVYTVDQQTAQIADLKQQSTQQWIDTKRSLDSFKDNTEKTLREIQADQNDLRETLIKIGLNIPNKAKR